MPKYASFDPSINPSPVTGWYDTDLLKYPNLPEVNTLCEVSDTEWNTRMTGFWAIADGKNMVPGEPRPAPERTKTETSSVPTSEWLARFSSEELNAIHVAAMQQAVAGNGALMSWMTVTTAATKVDVSSSVVKDNVQNLVSGGLLANKARAKAILATIMV